LEGFFDALLSLRSFAFSEAEVEDRKGRTGDEEADGGTGRRGGRGRLVERVELPEAGHGAGEVVGIDCLGDALGECLISRRDRKEVSRSR
jgi:hypothetical protein